MTHQSPQATFHPNHPMQPPAPPEKNIVGTVALVTAIIGFIFACIPGALILGWILLPIAFVLAIVGLVLKNKTRKSSIAALILSIVGTIVAIIVFIAVVGNAVDDALNQNVTVEAPATSTADEPAVSEPAAEPEDTTEADSPAEEEAVASPDGTRANPYPIGSKLTGEDWSVVVNSVDLDATDAVMAENQFNDPPEDGNVYILVNITATYSGSDPDGDMPWVSVAYVSAGGNTFDILTFDTFAVAPGAFDSLATLYEGASTSGNILVQVPADGVADGVLAVSPSLFSDKVFVSVQ